MSVMTGSIEYRRLRAPREDGGTLIEPPLESAEELIRHNTESAAQSNVDLQGRTLRDVAQQARADLICDALRYTQSYRDVTDPQLTPTTPILLAGHQPQLFHPGVWFKNFVLGRLAARHHAIAVNLVIDSDTMKTASLRVPTGSVERPTVVSLPFDEPAAEIPYEQRTIVDQGCLASFGTRAATMLRPLIPDPLIEQFWPMVVEQSESTTNLGACLAQARHRQEGLWDLETLELPQSRICALEGFHQFVCHMLAQLPRLWDTYNSAVADYRRANHVRSRVHPVPNLGASDEWIEAPLWLWSDADPRRRRVFVRQVGDELVLTDRGSVQLALSLTPEGDGRQAVAQLAELPARGIKLRTRALITTMFARLVLGDLFLHGVGGAKYDEVTDLMIRRFFGIEPPKYMTVTATLRLPIDKGDAPNGEASIVSDRLRQLTYHPERFLDSTGNGGELAKLVDTKRGWISTPQTRENARQRCRAIRDTNEALASHLGPQRAELQLRREAIAHFGRARTILDSREYAFCLYPERTLRRLFDRA